MSLEKLQAIKNLAAKKQELKRLLDEVLAKENPPEIAVGLAEDDYALVNDLDDLTLTGLISDFEAYLINPDGPKSYQEYFEAKDIITAKKLATDYFEQRLLPVYGERVRLFKQTKDTADKWLVIDPEFSTENLMFNVYQTSADLEAQFKARKIPSTLYYTADGKKYHELNCFKLFKESAWAQNNRIDALEPMPNKPPVVRTKFNTYIDTTVEPVECEWEEIAFIEEFIDRIYSKGNKELTTYFLNWLAHLFQYPDQLPKRALTFTSTSHGAGKNLWWDFLENCIDPNKTRRNMNKNVTREDIAGTFNGGSTGKLLIILNEVVFGGDHETRDKMKLIISEESANLQLKFQESASIPNFTRLITLSNSPENGSTEELGGRRFVFFDVEENIDEEYLVSVANRLGNNKEKPGRGQSEYIPNCEGKFVYHMLKRDISNFNPRKAPVSSTGMAAKISNYYRIDSVVAWVVEWLGSKNLVQYYTNSNSIDRSVEHMLRWTNSVTLSSFHAAYEFVVSSKPNTKPLSKGAKFNAALEKMGFKVYAGSGGVRMVHLPHPKYVLDYLTKVQFNGREVLVSPEQEEFIFSYDQNRITENQNNKNVHVLYDRLAQN